MRDCFLLSPYTPPTSYPVSLQPEEATAWLAAYLAAWHPAVLHHGSIPQIAGVYDHDIPRDGALYLIPTGPHLYQASDWDDLAAQVEALVLRPGPDLAATRAQLLERLAPPETLTSIDPLLIEQFAGVGLAYLTIETLFDAASHEHLLDTAGFWADVQAATNAVLHSQPSEALAHLRMAAEKLLAAREIIAASGFVWVDYCIPGQQPFHWPHSPAANLIVEGDRLAELLASRPPMPADARLDVLGSVRRSRAEAMLPMESQLWNIRQGRKLVQEHVQVEPTLFARPRGELHPSLPGWLRQMGYLGAVVTNLDGAVSPLQNCTFAHWPGPDGRTLDLLCREPLPAHDPSTFMNLAYQLYQATSRDVIPTLTLFHSGAPAAVGYAQLVAFTTLGEALGTFRFARECLDGSPHGEYIGTASADDFFTDSLDSRVSEEKRADPVSGFVRHLRRRRQFDAITTLAALYQMLTPTAVADHDTEAIAKLEHALECAGADDPAPAVDEQLAQAEANWTARLGERIQARSPVGQPGWLLFNPCSVARRVGLTLPPGPLPDVGGPLKAIQADADGRYAVVELAALGYAWIPATAGQAPPPRPRIVAASGTTVRNEFLEAELDPQTGAIRVLRDLRTRINRLGMQLVYQPGSTMRAESIQVVRSGSALGELLATGQLLDAHEQILARYTLRLRAWAGRPGLEVQVTLTPQQLPIGYPWHGYYGARFAYRDSRATLFRGVQGINSPAHGMRPGSPDYIEARLAAERTFVFTGGLPFAQKHGNRMVDVILQPEGETSTTFDFLLALDRENPMGTAVGWTTPTPMIATDRGAPPSGPEGWLGHIDLPTLILTSLRPDTIADGRAVRASFLETAGYGGIADFRLARPPGEARIFHDDQSSAPLSQSADAVTLEFSAQERLEIQLAWPNPS